MFAGPNGSGKSTIKSYVATQIGEELFGYYINPDELEKHTRLSGFLDFSLFDIFVTENKVLDFFASSQWLNDAGLSDAVNGLKVTGNKLYFRDSDVNSYLISVASDLIRRYLVSDGKDVTFETVMSSSDKIGFLAETRTSGYRNYLYYVATQDPEINISRVRIRVNAGGHDVANDKIVSRYYRSLDNLLDAIKLSDRAYIFDNSGDRAIWIAEVTNGTRIEIQDELVPEWFKQYVLDRV